MKKAIYGLKQAPQAWFIKLSDQLMSYGFRPSISNASLFIWCTPQHSIYILIYVDDILIMGSSSYAIHTLNSSLGKSFPIKHLGTLTYFLGIEAKFSIDGLFLSQQQYILDLLKKTNMLTSKPVNSPMAPSMSKLSIYDGQPMSDPTLYRSVVGSLQYLSFTRPDLAFAVNKVCQFMHSPTYVHWQSVKRILRYLCGTSHYGLLLRASSSSQITVYSDADWAGCQDDRRSTGAFLVYYGPNLISWSSWKQSTVAHSSTEDEYKAQAIATCDVIWVQSLLGELGIYLKFPPLLCCDNLGATYLAANPVMHSRTKHIALDYHFVRERLATKLLRLKLVSSKDQLADVLTKPLPAPRFQQLRSTLSVDSPTARMLEHKIWKYFFCIFQL